MLRNFSDNTSYAGSFPPGQAPAGHSNTASFCLTSGPASPVAFWVTGSAQPISPFTLARSEGTGRWSIIPFSSSPVAASNAPVMRFGVWMCSWPPREVIRVGHIWWHWPLTRCSQRKQLSSSDNAGRVRGASLLRTAQCVAEADVV